MTTTTKKEFMEIIREFSIEHPVSDDQCLSTELHNELCRILSDHGYREEHLKELEQRVTVQDKQLILKYIHRANLVEIDHSENGCVDYFLSGCCGAGEYEYAENYCGACAEFAEWECSVCEKTRDDSGR